MVAYKWSPASGWRCNTRCAVIHPHRVAHLHYNLQRKTATIPSVRVDPEFRAEVESVRSEGESLSEFVEASARASVERRRAQAEFMARGM